MKKILISLLFVTLVLVGCSSKPADDKKEIVVGVVGDHYKYWDPVIEQLEKEGITLTLKVFSEYSIPNKALHEKEIDLNAFQHYLYINQEIEEFGYDIEVLAETILDPLGIYSDSLGKDFLDTIEDGATVLIPDDVTNGGRGLKLLEAAGLIKVDASKGYVPSLLDITENSKNLDIRHAKSDLIPSMLKDVSLAVINGDLAVSSGKTPSKDSVFLEDIDIEKNPAVKDLINVIGVRTEDKDNKDYLRVKELFQSQEVIDVMNDFYGGAFVPAWK